MYQAYTREGPVVANDTATADIYTLSLRVALPTFNQDAALLPHRIEHTQMIRSEDIQRLAKLKVAACVQPHNMILDINMIDESVGERGRWTYAYKEMLDAGIAVLFSSDAPVCDPSPLVGIHAAVTRQRRDGTPEGGWYPEQRIRVEDAVRGYTTVPAAFIDARGFARSSGVATMTKVCRMSGWSGKENAHEWAP